MAKHMILWRANPSTPWPLDPTELAQLIEMMYAAMDEQWKSGRLLEYGCFPEGTSGYAISSDEAKDILARAFANLPWYQFEVHEIIDYETEKEVMRTVLKAQAEQMAAMKR